MTNGVIVVGQKRFKQLAYIFLIAISLLMFRLMQIQLFDTKSFSKHHINLIEASVNQRTQEVILDNGRGKFFDKYHNPISFHTIPSLILFPFLNNMDWDKEKVAKILGVSIESLLLAIKDAKEPVVFGDPDPFVLSNEQMEAINQLEIPGVFAVYKQFDRELTTAAQLIGILGENEKLLKERYPNKKLPINTLIGITGLQKSFDEFLLQEEKTKLLYHVDGIGGPLFGIDVKYVDPSNPFYPVHVITTLDMEIQKAAEKIVDENQIKKGGLILIDIESNTILANVSRPSLNIEDPYTNDNVKNFMFTQSIPGSVFKTVIAAAAIDYNLVPKNRIFDCNQTIYGKKDTKYQKGNLNFKESFAQSCNHTFGTLAKELAKIDEKIIETYSEKLGLINEVGWSGDVFHFENFTQLSDEDKGIIFISDEERMDPNYVAQTGIGQRNVRITPLQAANMMATIARGGKKEMVRAVSSIEYKNGTTLYHFQKKPLLSSEQLAPYTVMKLQQLLREVVTNEKGTGRMLNNLPYQVAGKSGTAETNRYIDEKHKSKDTELQNSWFVGYFPFEKPKYALAVVKLDTLSSEKSATHTFYDMVNFLYQYDKKN